MKKPRIIALALALCLTLTTATAFAFNIPSDTDMFYSVYTFIVTVTTGAAAYAVGLVGLFAGGILMFKQNYYAVLGIGAGLIVIFSASTIMQKFGYIMA